MISDYVLTSRAVQYDGTNATELLDLCSTLTPVMGYTFAIQEADQDKVIIDMITNEGEVYLSNTTLTGQWLVTHQGGIMSSEMTTERLDLLFRPFPV